MLAEELLDAAIVEEQQQPWAQPRLADTFEGVDLLLPVKQVAGAGMHTHQHHLRVRKAAEGGREVFKLLHTLICCIDTAAV